MAQLVYDGVRKTFAATTALQHLDLEVKDGELISLLGPSGCGKTTALRIAAGFEFADSGEVYVGARKISGVPAHKRNMGMVFQSYSLFPNLTVEQNVLAILETLDLSSTERRQRAKSLLAELNLSALAGAPAYTLSGGERRRAEITRALVMSPRFILLDEPFAGIDPIAVTDIQQIIFHLKSRGIGVLITDHNVRETLRITDRAYIVADGVIFKSGTPHQLAADADVRRIYLGADFRLD